MRNARWLLLVMAATWLATVGQAHADGANVEVLMQVKPPDRNNPKTKDDAPQIEVTAIGAPNLPVDKFTLREEGAKQPIELKAISKREYNQGTEKLAIAIVMNGWEIWIGNDKVLPEDDPSRYPGVLESFEGALEKVDFKNAGPAGSVGAVITYADKAVVRIPMGPLDKITGSQLGSQKDYFGTKGVELVKGVDLGLTELHKVQASRKVLIVVCDGMDTNMEAAKGQLQILKQQAKNDQIQTFAIIYKSAMSGDGNVISPMIPSTQTVNSADNIATAIAGILTRMADRQYLTFPGFDPKVGLGLTWDGKLHNLILKVDKDDAEPTPLSMAPPWNVAKPGFPWLILILVVVGALLLIIIGVKVFGAKPALPPPLIVAAPAPEPAKPAGPMKTVMMSSGGDDGGFPIVGWLVPINGVQAYQTFKLRSGGTKIGTAPPCDIVVNDGFMSTEHCQINASPQGFMLVDGGSTNGCYVNDRKIQGKQDLVDNDMVTLGKTNFKFKSIN
ncbi:MAG TPA: FHA domain-containing protein [Kofleriaceae bacterium]|nr:FHA domain-containing protein [Kofleriaceae bacterium]